MGEGDCVRWSAYFPGRDWAKVPLKIKQGWWKATDYGRFEPSDEFVRETIAVLDQRRKDDD